MNLSFEDSWIDIGDQQQQPNNWVLTQTEPGQVMGVPTKHAGGIEPYAGMVDALAQAKAEAVHKGHVLDKGTNQMVWNLPDNEFLGQPRAVILDGERCYKLFWGLANENRLSAIITGIPGSMVTMLVPVLGESNLIPTPPNVKLEDDNFWATVKFGNTIDRRNYLQMTNVKQVVGNERNWNVFSCAETFPASGQLPLTITLQDNWGGTDWFVDGLAIVGGNPTPTPLPIPAPQEQEIVLTFDKQITVPVKVKMRITVE